MSEAIKKLPAWARLYLASKEKLNMADPDEQKPKGRPQRHTPAKKTTIYLSPDDKEVLIHWQDIFSGVSDHKVSLGETVALLARIARDRYEKNHVEGDGQIEDMGSLLAILLENRTSEES